MILKLDLEKAYDRVDWSFLRETLIMYGFPNSIVKLIMHGISSSTITLLWNGDRMESFAPKRGLRQGDPLSPYLFVLCMERLGELISKENREGRWEPIRVSKNGPSISHLFFADDVLLFAKAKVSQARVMKNTLDAFCSLSGLKVSIDKSTLFASKGVSNVKKHKVKQILGVSFTQHLGKYLGFKIFQGKVTKADFNEVLDRVQSRLASWKGRLLNKAGRLTLSKAVLSSIPAYGMQVQWYPQSVCDQLDKMIRDFIWQGNGEKGMHMVGWKTITRPVREGGLGVRCARHNNTALLGKLIWDIIASPEKLWVDIFKDKYIHNKSFMVHKLNKGSCTWNSVLKALEHLRCGFKFKLGDGSCSFWYSDWMSNTPLCMHVPFVDIHDRDVEVKDVWINGEWQLDNLYTSIPVDNKSSILQIRPLLADGVLDAWTWGQHISGIYSTRSAFYMLNASNRSEVDNQSWAWIWKLKLPANLQFFIWQLAHKSLPLHVTLAHRKMHLDTTCVLCNANEESMKHFFFECCFVREVWNYCGHNVVAAPCDDVVFVQWLWELIQDHGILYIAIMWRCWLARNKKIFEGEHIHARQVSAQALALCHDISKAFMATDGREQRVKSSKMVSWPRAPMGFVALNVDGSALTNPGKAGFGGLIRDESGKFLRGYYGSLGVSHILHAELVGLLKGVALCWDMGYRKVVCYTDSLHTLHLLSQCNTAYHQLGNKIALRKELMGRQWEIQIQHAYRESNFCADFLAKLGANCEDPLIQLDAPPSGLLPHLDADVLGISFVRP